jgi:hypothetical protein
VFTHQDAGGFGSQAAKGGAFCIDDVPITTDVFSGGYVSFHTFRVSLIKKVNFTSLALYLSLCQRRDTRTSFTFCKLLILIIWLKA